MIKKLIILTIAVLMFTACSNSKPAEKNEKNSSIKVEKKVLSKDVTLSKKFLELAEITNPQETIDNLISENKIKSGKVNEDGSVTYTFTQKQHSDFMKDMKDNLVSSNQDIINDTTNSVTDIKHNDSFSTFDIYVDPNTYTELESFMALGFYIQGGFYRMLNGDKETNVVVNFINKDTGDIINTADSSALLEAKSSNANNQEDVEVKVEDLPYSIVEQKPDSIGSVYGIATYTNNSKYPIKYFELLATLPSTNENTYFTSTDTVMPGEASPNFESFYEKDAPINSISYTYVKDGQEIHVEYDVKLKSYSSY